MFNIAEEHQSWDTPHNVRASNLDMRVLTHNAWKHVSCTHTRNSKPNFDALYDILN